jgi:RNA polymerase primary sigma factor
VHYPKANSVEAYLNAIGRTPLLTTDQEIELGRKVQRMVALQQEEEQGRELTPREAREVRVGKRAMELFVKANLRLVVNVAKRYYRVVTHMDLMDLVQEGNIGLMHGVLKFDPARGYKFSTYAYWWIRQAMSRAISTKERVVRLPGKVADMAANWSNAIQVLGQRYGRMPRTEELAEHFNVTVEDVQLYVNRGQQVYSLDHLALDGEGSPLSELICDPDDPGGEDSMRQAEQQEMISMLEGAFRFLTEKEAELVRRHWGIPPYSCETYTDIGRQMGVSRERVRQIVDVAHRKMRRYMAVSNSFTSQQAGEALAECGARR